MSSTVAVLCVVLVAAHATAENCVVNDRLPLFALGAKQKAAREVPRATMPASLLPGGACHMSRLARVHTHRTEDPMPGATYSTQMCTRNSTRVSCAMLAQKSSDPASSRQHLHHFTAETPADAGIDTTRKHGRRSLCSSCHRKDLSSVLTRLLRTTPVLKTARRQLSVGVPRRISTARLVAAQLHRDICGVNKTCPRLRSIIDGACEHGGCLRRDKFMASLFAQVSVDPTAHAPKSSPARVAHNDALWSRNWVFCPHTQNMSEGAVPDAAETTNGCKGSVSKSAWLNHTTRAQECAAVIGENIQEDATSINFCLLNAETQYLCSRMEAWQQKTEKILCEAAGACPVTDFFYTPTTFNIQEQEFVHSTVLRFYQEDAGRSCPSAQNRQQKSILQAQYNNALLQQCSSVSIEPLLVVVQQLRTAKRMLVLVAYHGVRVCFRLLEVFVAVTTLDGISELAGAASNAAEAAASRLLQEIVALMQVIGNFVEHLAESITELALSRGVGSFFKEMMYAVCVMVEWIYNNIWAKIVCHIVVFVLELANIIVNVWETIVNILQKLFLPVDALQAYTAFIRDVLNRIGDTLAQCEEKDFECALGSDPQTDGGQPGTLPMPTRCWSTYISFFGDNQQLSCTRADTCKAGSLDSERVVCGACPPQSNPSIRDFACDYITSICTCGVPEFSTTSCLVNEDCLHSESEASCLLLNNDLQTSRYSVPCDQCQSQRVCYHTSLGDVGVCACGAQERNFQLCSAEEASQQSSLSLMLSNLCLYTPTADSAPSYEVEFAQTSVIACQELDPLTASCAYVVDKNAYVVRGYRSSGRRLLADGGRTPDSISYASVDPACLDALVSDSLPHTRASCQALFDSSSATLALLGLDRQLPPCALCSFDDALDATRRNPLAVLRIVSSPHILATVLRRHGPADRLLKLLASLHAGIHTAAGRITAANAAGLVAVERGAGSVVVRVDDTVLPPSVARALEAWVAEAIRHDEARATAGHAGANASHARVNTSRIERPRNAAARRLLLFQELVLAVEERVRDGWDQAGRLHEAFAQGVTQILTYRHLARDDALGDQQWGSSPPSEQCDELRELLHITVRTADGVMQGWLTLTHRRDELQSRPADTLAEAWPKLLRPAGADAVPDHLFKPPAHSDLLIQLAADAVNATLDALNVQPSIFYDLVFSAASAANASFTCPYEAVQTCSRWRVRLWHGFIIVSLYFSAAALLASAVGFSFVTTFILAAFFAIVLTQLCYGYTWTCAPMIPVCAWQDFTESVNTLLPLSLDLPDDLKKTGLECRDHARCPDPSRPCLVLHRYPPAECLKSCRDPPFAYTSAASVLAWGLAEMWLLDPLATQYALNNSHHVPLFDHAHFNQQLKSHIVALRRASPDFIRAQRLCAGLSAYLLIPYLVLLLFIVSFLSALIPLLAAQLYPFLILVFSLFTAASADAEPLAYDSDAD